jgi:hypothetical protein
MLTYSVTILTACTSIGTKQLSGNRLGFADAMILSEEQLLLQNIVRLHFEDRPYFVSVESITTSNSLSLNASPSASYSTSPSRSLSKQYTDMDNSLLLISRDFSDTFSKNVTGGFSPGVSYSDSPTISYLPLQGDKFTHQMLDPISLNTLSAMLKGGWLPAKLLRIVSSRIGNNENISYVSKKIIPDDRKFIDLINHIKKLTEDNMIYFDLGQVEYVSYSSKAEKESGYLQSSDSNNGLTPQATSTNNETSVSSISDNGTSKLSSMLKDKDIAKISPVPSLDLIIVRKYRRSPQIRKLFNLLDIGYPAKTIHFVNNTTLALINSSDNIVELRTRSFLNILGYLANSVDTPPELIKKGLIQAPRYLNGSIFPLTQLTNGVLHVYMSNTKPQRDVSVSIFYRNHWFYILDTDITSKKTFSLVEQLFNLQAGSVSNNNAPTLTIPVR